MTISFKNGDPISINNKKCSPSKLLSLLNNIGGKNGVGRVDLVEKDYEGKDLVLVGVLKGAVMAMADFSRKLLNLVTIESMVGFSYSLELLVKCDRLKMKISEIPAQWEERSEGQSRFKVLKWLPQYTKWYIYGLSSTWLNKKWIKTFW